MLIPVDPSIFVVINDSTSKDSGDIFDNPVYDFVYSYGDPDTLNSIGCFSVILIVKLFCKFGV